MSAFVASNDSVRDAVTHLGRLEPLHGPAALFALIAAGWVPATEYRRHVLEEAADLADCEGHLWSGLPARAAFRTAERLRALANGTDS